ncbi:Uncharacterized membrane protein YheB, UPF0754 family [Tepidimicrobium xylanilyticum]|uniref:Uncharacterized membrane protein YheB, UPF0754 family n=1 Tax=Tepidimicrobium xylanilyticum TaxID=1123352 RepID=A0A1H2ZG07_9FIRM|nr:Uncharacterized membrane protein YheB, UPF0754 family [Tepidimicrobium xylanilyticum]
MGKYSIKILLEYGNNVRGEDVNYIIPVIVGAVIGYITNWIAIKMLFRPHYEKRIFNIPIPFTPGLIPKEKNRIAKSIGEAVGEYLLSPEIVVNSLLKDDGSIDKLIINYMKKLKTDDRTLKSIILSLNYGEFEKLKGSIKTKLADIIVLQFCKDQFKDGLINLIDEYIFIDSKGSIYGIMREILKNMFNLLVKSEEVKRELNVLLMEKINQFAQDERTLYEVIPEEIISRLKDTIIQNEQVIITSLKDVLDNPKIQNQLKKWIAEMFSHNMNKLIAIFISPELISDRIVNLLDEYINNPDRNKDIISFILLVVDKVLKKEVRYVFGGLTKELKEEDMLLVSEFIIQGILKEYNQYKIIDKLEERLKSEEENIKRCLLAFIRGELEKFLDSNNFYNYILFIVNNAIESILNRPISSLIVNINEDDILSIVNFLKIIIENLIKNQLPNMVKAFNISKIVEDQINGFDVAFTEELILEIANRELKAITWLGGLLGGIIGLLTPILTMLY